MSYLKRWKLIRDYNKLRPVRMRKIFCNAPFTSIRFHRNGGIHACCHQSDFLFLKNKTVSEVWFGDDMKQIRRQMRKFDIPASCNFCSSSFYSQKFANINALEFDNLIPDKDGYPVLLDFSIDNNCNLACVMCDSSLSSVIRRNKNIPDNNSEAIYNSDFVKQLDIFIPHLQIALFTGGEPFLINIYYEIWEQILKINPNVRISIITNGTVFNHKIKSLLNRGKFNITVSLDSLDSNVYSQIRKGADFEKTMLNIREFASYCVAAGTEFTITTCPMQINWKEIPAIIEMCNSQNWNFSYNTVLKPWDMALWSLPAYELKLVIETYRTFLSENDSNVELSSNINKLNSLISLLEHWLDKNMAGKINESGDTDLLRESLKESVVKKITHKGISSDDYLVELVSVVFDNLPEMLITKQLLDYVESAGSEVLLQEFIQNDSDTIIEHLTVISFNL